MRAAYEGWAVNQFAGPTIAGEEIFPRSVVPASSRRVSGRRSTPGRTPTSATSQLTAALLPRLAVLAQKTWRSPPLTPDYAKFLSIVAAIGSLTGAEPLG